MDPVLLGTDAERITDEQETLANVVTLYQSVYNAILAVGITAPTLVEVDKLVQAAKTQQVGNADNYFSAISGLKNLAPDFVTNYVTNKLVAQAMPFAMNGVQLTAAAVAKMIVVPDVSGITTALQPVTGGNAQNIFIGDAKATRLNLLSLAANVISAVAGADATIAALFTYYTVNDASASLATQLLAVCTALNTFDAANDNFFLLKMPPPPDTSYNAIGTVTAFPGIAVLEGEFVVDREFIENYERFGTLDFMPSINSLLV
jgi:hypothetical protein